MLESKLNFKKSFWQKLKDAAYRAMRETYVDKVERDMPSRFNKFEDNTERSTGAGFFGFRRADYSSRRGKALLAWDILTVIPTVAVNIVALLTEVLPLSFKNLGDKERIGLAFGRIESPLKRMKDCFAGKQNNWERVSAAAKAAGIGLSWFGYQASYFGGSIFYYIGRSITSPSKNIQDCFSDWKKKSTAGKIAAVFKGIGSAILTSVAYTFLFPFIVAAIVATPVLTVAGATIIGGGYLLGNGLTALASIPVIGPAVKGLGAAILKGLNSIPGVNAFVNWLVPAKPPITIIPGDPVATYQYNMQVKASLQAQVEFIKAEVATGFLSGVAATARGIVSTAVKGIRSLFGSSDTTSKPEIETSNVKIGMSIDAALARLKTDHDKEKQLDNVVSDKNLPDVSPTSHNITNQVPPGESLFDSSRDFTQITGAANQIIELPKQTQPSKNETKWWQFWKEDSKKEKLRTNQQQLWKDIGAEAQARVVARKKQ